MVPSQPTILLVDDEQAILSTLRRSLRNEGYRILTTTTPEEVLAILEAEQVDVLVSDVNMPAMSGLELVAQSRAAFPSVVRVLLTAQQSLELVLEAINRGEVFRYLTKPWENDKLREAIRAAARHADVLRRAAALDAAVSRRMRALAEVVRREPRIQQVERTNDGAYALDVATDRLRAALALGAEQGDGPQALLGRLLGEISAKGAAPEEPAPRLGDSLGATEVAPVALRFPLAGDFDRASSNPSGAPSSGGDFPPAHPAGRPSVGGPIETFPSETSSLSMSNPLARSSRLGSDSAPRTARSARPDRMTRRPHAPPSSRLERNIARPRAAAAPASSEKLWRSTKPQGSPSPAGVVAAPGSTAVRVLGPGERISSPSSAPLEPSEKPPSRAALWTAMAFVVVLALVVALLALSGR